MAPAASSIVACLVREHQQQLFPFALVGLGRGVGEDDDGEAEPPRGGGESFALGLGSRYCDED